MKSRRATQNRATSTPNPRCRTELAFRRFWEGHTELQTFASKLTDVVVQCVTFDRTCLPVGATDKQVESHERFRDTLVHLISLLHAVGLETLREDYDFDNLRVCPPSALDLAAFRRVALCGPSGPTTAPSSHPGHRSPAMHHWSLYLAQKYA
jgi:hypothetical protein